VQPWAELNLQHLSRDNCSCLRETEQNWRHQCRPAINDAWIQFRQFAVHVSVILQVCVETKIWIFSYNAKAVIISWGGGGSDTWTHNTTQLFLQFRKITKFMWCCSMQSERKSSSTRCSSAVWIVLGLFLNYL